MIKHIIALMTVMTLVLVTAQAGYSQTSSGFTVTTIALDAANIQMAEVQVEDENATIKGENSEK